MTQDTFKKGYPSRSGFVVGSALALDTTIQKLLFAQGAGEVVANTKLCTGKNTLSVHVKIVTKTRVSP